MIESEVSLVAKTNIDHFPDTGKMVISEVFRFQDDRGSKISERSFILLIQPSLSVSLEGSSSREP